MQTEVRMRRLIDYTLCVSLVAAGCSDNSPAVNATDLAQMGPGMPDLVATPDLVMPDLTMGIGIGNPCPTGTECAANQICLGPQFSSSLPPGGHCPPSCVT